MQHPDQRTSHPGPRRRPRVVLTAAVLSLCVATAGCGPGPEVRVGGGELLTVGARRGAPPPARLRSGARLARSAAAVYAAGAYRRRPPVLPEETGSVTSAIAAAAGRVPRSRRRLHPELRGLRLHAIGVDRIAATAEVGDGVSPPFTVGIELHWRRGWRVVAISLPD
jgi:hypothetical protein